MSEITTNEIVPAVKATQVHKPSATCTCSKAST